MAQDPFAPPGHTDSTGAEPDLQLARDIRRPAAPVAEEPLPLPSPRQREAVTYRKPPGGIGNLVVFGLAAVGLGAAVLFGAKLLKRGVEGADPAVAAGTASAPAGTKAAAPAPAKPVVWKAVETGEAVLITVEVTPRAARLLLDGAPLPSNPVRLAKGATHTITGVADGFQPASVQVTAEQPRTVRLKLKRD